jgi:hypothetical protein
MAAVAKRFVFGMFAGAPRDHFAFIDLHFERGELAAFMRPIAKRLRRGTSARTPPKRPGFGLLHDGAFLKNNRIAHAIGFSGDQRRRQTKTDGLTPDSVLN